MTKGLGNVCGMVADTPGAGLQSRLERGRMSGHQRDTGGSGRKKAFRCASGPPSAEHIGGDPTGDEGSQQQRRQAKKCYCNLISEVFHWLLPFMTGNFADDYGLTAILPVGLKAIEISNG